MRPSATAQHWSNRQRQLPALLGGGVLLVVSSSAMADDIPAPQRLANTVGLELTPELDAKSGELTDGYLKANIAHSFDSGLIWAGTFQFTDKVGGDRQYQAETTIGYAFRLSESWSMPVSAGPGFFWDEDPTTKPSPTFAYYVINAGLNMRISDSWTWNAIAARWRDAFEGGWQTPKITTGLTYVIDSRDSVYANVGYAWKNGEPDKISLTAGYRYGF
jgi:hypothetical protein